MSHHPEILKDVLTAAESHLKQSGAIFKAIFDLDSTLFDVNPRVLTILHEFASIDSMRLKYPSACAVLEGAIELKNSYRLKDQLIHMGLPRQSPEFYPLLLEFWKSRFFSNEYLQYDVPYDGAVEFVQRLHQMGAHIYYLTGRDVTRMGVGTEKSLRQWEFPVGERAELALKPFKEMDDALFKRDYLLALPRENVEVWFFENEPVNIDMVLREVNHVKVVYFDSVHMEQAEPPGPHIPRLKGTWSHLMTSGRKR